MFAFSCVSYRFCRGRTPFLQAMLLNGFFRRKYRHLAFGKHQAIITTNRKGFHVSTIYYIRCFVAVNLRTLSNSSYQNLVRSTVGNWVITLKQAFTPNLLTWFINRPFYFSCISYKIPLQFMFILQRFATCKQEVDMVAARWWWSTNMYGFILQKKNKSEMLSSLRSVLIQQNAILDIFFFAITSVSTPFFLQQKAAQN